MGLEKIVLSGLEERGLAEGAYFKHGTLWIPNENNLTRGTLTAYRIVNALKEIVNCSVQTNLVGNEVSVDFMGHSA